MSRIRLIILAALAVFAVSAVASASSASAFNFEWEVNPCHKVTAGTGKYENHECKKEGGTKEWELEGWKVLTSSSEVYNVVSRVVAGTKFELVVGTKKVTCTGETDKGTITGGSPGTDLITTVFTGCTTSEAGGECKVRSEGKLFGEIEVPENPTKLVERETSTGTKVEADEFKPNTVTNQFAFLEFEKTGGGACPEFPNTAVTGQVAGETSTTANANGFYETIFPNPELKGNSLVAFGKAAKFFGKAETELETGGKVKAS